MGGLKLSALGDYRILYIEDDLELAELCSHILSVKGFAIEIAATGKDGLRKFKKQPHDIVLLDNRLPDTDGIALARSLIKSSPGLPVVLITGKGSEDVAAEALSVGVTQYIKKGSLEVYEQLLPEVLSRIVNDLEGKKNTERLRLEHEAALEEIYENSPTAQASVSVKNGSIIRHNQKFVELLGYTSAQLKKMHVFDLCTDDETGIGNSKKNMAVLKKGNQIVDAELTMRRRNGDVIWIQLNASPVLDEDDVVIQSQSVLTDITSRKNAEDALVRSEEKLRAVLETAADGIITIDDHGKIESVNSMMGQMFGYSNKEMIGQNVSILMPEPDHSAHDGYLSKFNAGGEKKIIGIGRDVDARRKDGTIFPMHLSVSETVVGDTKLFTGIIHDITERIEAEDRLRQGERSLRESEERYRLTFENAHIGVLTADVDGNFTKANKAFCRMLGYSEKEILERHISNLTHPDDVERSLNAHQRFHDDQLPDYQIDKRYIHKNGRVVWCSLNIAKIYDPNDKFINVVAHIEDITGRKETEEQLRQNEQTFRSIFENAQDGIFLIDPDTKQIVDVNRLGAERLGYTAEELTGISLKTISQPAGGKTAQEKRIKQIAKDGGSVLRESKHTRKDGSVISVEVSSSVVKRGGKNLVLSMARDITKRKEALNRQELLQKAIDSVSEGIMLMDGEDRFVLCNQRFLEQSPDLIDLAVPGTPFEEFVRRLASIGQNAEMIGREEEWIKERLDGHKELKGTTSHRVHNDLVLMIREYRTPDGGTLIIRTDITEQSHIEIELREEKKRADYANLAKSEFLASMSHELRTPLNAILGFGQLLQYNPREPLSETQLDHSRQIVKGGEQLLDLIDQVLELSKIEAGKVSLTVDNVVPSLTIGECIGMVANRAAESDVNIVYQSDPDDLEVLRTDEIRFRQVLLNLLSNAIKYNQPGGSVTITSELALNNFRRISVIDTGIGIPKEKQDGLYEPFNRLGLEAGDIEGTGIGLTITKQIMELLGGRIGYESAVGVGTTFWIELPISEDQSLSKNEVVDNIVLEIKLDLANANTQSILYIEDNPSNLALMEAVIARIPKLAMLSAPNAETGLDMAKSHLPDLILMDINLPGMDGVEALNKLRSQDKTKNIPVIALTAAAMPHEIERGIEAGFEQYVTKPIKITEVLDAFNRYLN